MFLLIFSVSIPIMDFQLRPRLEFDVPEAVRNELIIETSDQLELLDNDNLYEIEGATSLSPTRPAER